MFCQPCRSQATMHDMKCFQPSQMHYISPLNLAIRQPVHEVARMPLLHSRWPSQHYQNYTQPTLQPSLWMSCCQSAQSERGQWQVGMIQAFALDSSCCRMQGGPG